MILGLGTDVCQISRVADYLERYGERFTRRCFTSGEVAHCRHERDAERYAGMVAAKEAAMKALGTGLREGVTWKSFEVWREPSGKPSLRIHGAAAERASRMGVRGVHLSITHDAGVAMAVVIFESD